MAQTQGWETSLRTHVVVYDPVHDEVRVQGPAKVGRPRVHDHPHPERGAVRDLGAICVSGPCERLWLWIPAAGRKIFNGLWTGEDLQAVGRVASPRILEGVLREVIGFLLHVCRMLVADLAAKSTGLRARLRRYHPEESHRIR